MLMEWRGGDGMPPGGFVIFYLFFLFYPFFPNFP